MRNPLTRGLEGEINQLNSFSESEKRLKLISHLYTDDKPPSSNLYPNNPNPQN
jgi:hypothetical protein